MVNSGVVKMIRFLDIAVDTVKRRVFKNGNLVKISDLNFDLLVYFLNNTNKIISKNELMKNVWGNRMVSDSTIYKQVKRLEKDLADNFSTKDVVQTIHGQGFMFVIEVNADNPKTSIFKYKLTCSKSNFPVWLLIIAVLGFIVFQINTIKQKNINILDRVERLAIFYQEENNTGSYNRAIAAALRSQMLVSDQLNIKLESSNSPEKSFKQTSTTMVHELGYNHVLNMRVITHDYGVRAHVLLRKGNEIFPPQTFETTSLNQLMGEVSDWVLKKLEAHDSFRNNTLDMTEVESAFEDFLAALRYEFENKVELSTLKLEQAVKKDPKFWMAWNKLAASYRKRGEVDKALATLDRIDLTQVSKRLRMIILNTQAGCYYRLGQLELAVASLDEVLKYARKLNDPTLRLAALINQANIFISLNLLSKSQKNLDEALLYVDKNYQKDLLSYIYNSLASVYKENYNMKMALYYVELSYENYKLIDRIHETNLILEKWAYLLLGHAEFDKAYEKARMVFEHSKTNKSDIVVGLFALKTMMNIDLKYGRFDQARLELNDFQESLRKIENSKLQAGLLMLEFIYHMNTGQLKSAANFLEQFRIQSINLEDVYIKQDYALLKIDYVLKTQKEKIGDSQLSSLLELIVDDSHLLLSKARILAHNNQAEEAIILFEQVMEIYQQQEKNDMLIKSINYYLNFMLNHKNISEIDSSWIKKLDSLSPPPYPYLKNKALYLKALGDLRQATIVTQQLRDTANQWWTDIDEISYNSDTL